MAISGRRRVVVTGLGAITPCGITVEKFWDALVKGQSGIDYITLIDTTHQSCKIAGEIKDFKPEDYMDKKDARRMDRFMQLAMVAALEAYEDAGLSRDTVDPERFSVVIGSGSGGIGSIEKTVEEVREKGFHRCSPFFIPMMIPDMAAGRVSIHFNAQGPNMSVVTACATGADSIGNAFRMIQYGETDLAIAGGAEAPVTPMSVAGFAAAKALSCNSRKPSEVSRPFDSDRDGFVMGEGSCLLVLEEMERAVARGAKIYGELAGFGRTSDAFDIVQPHNEGRGAISAIRLSLKDGNLNPEDVNYVNA
ncbi:MAG: beta-ketoacyl-ACP synthase II, partial [Cyanobacteria bacterium]|nr:beta-ketoacyl-ACP synthase II [Cyanobacteriota bacterium]